MLGLKSLGSRRKSVNLKILFKILTCKVYINLISFFREHLLDERGEVGKPRLNVPLAITTVRSTFFLQKVTRVQLTNDNHLGLSMNSLSELVS